MLCVDYAHNSSLYDDRTQGVSQCFSTIDIDIPWDYVWHIRSPGLSGAQCQGPAAGDIFTDVAISYS